MNWFLYNEVADLSNKRWAQIILQATNHMAHHMEGWLFKKERQPLWYMTYLTEVIKKVGGPLLKQMRRYTLWIKPGSFYHLRIYQLGELKKCPHPLNLGPPKWDLEPPSITSLMTHESTFEVAKRNLDIDPEAFWKAWDKYSEALKLHGCNITTTTVKATLVPGEMPTTGGRDTPPSRRAQSEWESSSSDTTSHTEEEEDQDQTIPMEVYTSQPEGATGHSWSDWVYDKETWGQQSARCHKWRQGTSDYEGEAQDVPPFPFSNEARVVAVEKLFNEARASLSAQSPWIKLTLRHNIPALQCMNQGIVQLSNLLLIFVSEFHLTRSWGCGPILPPKIEGQLRDLREYLPHDDAGNPYTDVCEKDWGNLLRLACWFHCLDMAFTYSRGTAQSLRRNDHLEIGNLLCYLIAPGVGFLTSMEVIDWVLQENEDDTHRKLEEAKDNLKLGELRLSQIEKEIKEAKKELKCIQKQHIARPSDIQHAQRKYNHLCQEKVDKEEYLKQCRYERAYCQHYLDQQPPGEAPEWAAFTLGELPHQLTSATVELLPHTEEPTPPEGQDPQPNDDVEMQDNSLQGAIGGEGAIGGASPVSKEDKALLNEEEMPQTQVISEMQNLSVGSPANPTPSRSETKL